MTRRILGADATLHEGRPVIRIAVHPGSLQRVAGRVAFPGAGFVDVTWQRENGGIVYQVTSEAPWTLLRGGMPVECEAGTTELVLSASGVAFAP